MKKAYFLAIVLFLFSNLQAQLCPGGGLTYASSVGFNQAWLVNCPGSGTTHSNQVACEPTTTMDACGAAPACVSGTTGSDIWYYFYASAATASIVINPSASFDAAIQAFSGATCGTLVDIGCVDAGGNNQTETLNLTGLTIGGLYHFRIFGATNSAPNRTGTFTFCGTSASLRQFPLPVSLIDFTATADKSKIILQWSTASEVDNDRFEIQRSTDNRNYETVITTAASGDLNSITKYTRTDLGAEAGINFYRLKMIDLNGQYTYSPIVSVRLNYIKLIQIVSNPVRDVLLVQSKNIANVRIINSAGQQVKQAKLQPGRNSIQVSGLLPGMYWLQGTTDSEKGEQFIIER